MPIWVHSPPLSFLVISQPNVVQWQWKLEQIFVCWMNLSQSDYYPWTCYIFFVNKKKTKDVGELRQWTVEEWEQLSQHVIKNVIRQWRRRLWGCVDADGGQFEHSLWLTFWLPQWTSLPFLKCLTILYRLHCYMFSVVFAGADQIVYCKEYLLHIPQSPMSVESAFSNKNLLQILRKLAHYYMNYSQKWKGLFFYETRCIHWLALASSPQEGAV